MYILTYSTSPRNCRESLNSVCTVGFEPNPASESRLRQLQAAYSRCGWRVHFFARTAASNADGEATLRVFLNMSDTGATIQERVRTDNVYGMKQTSE